MSEPYRSRVYTDRPDYADLPAPEKFQAITGIIMTRRWCSNFIFWSVPTFEEYQKGKEK